MTLNSNKSSLNKEPKVRKQKSESKKSHKKRKIAEKENKEIQQITEETQNQTAPNETTPSKNAKKHKVKKPKISKADKTTKTIKISQKSKSPKTPEEANKEDKKKKKLPKNSKKTYANSIDEKIKEEAKSIWGTSFKTMKKSEKTEKCNKLLNALYGSLFKASKKKEMSRILEICLKHTDKDNREKVFEELKENFEELCCDKHGKFVITSLIKNLGFRAVSTMMGHFYKACAKLFVNRRGSTVLDLFFRMIKPSSRVSLLAPLVTPPAFLPEKPTKKWATFDEFFGENEESRAFYVKRMGASVRKVVEKEMLTTAASHYLIFEYVKMVDFTEKLDIFGRLAAHPLALAQSKLGSHLAVLVYSFIDQKKKKVFAKAIKAKVPEMAKDEFGWAIVSRCASMTDDTVFVNKNITSPIIEELQKEEAKADLISNKYFQKLILHLIDPNSKRFASPEETEILFEMEKDETSAATEKTAAALKRLSIDAETAGGKLPFCKKQSALRRGEVFAQIFPVLLESLSAVLSGQFGELNKTVFGRELIFYMLREIENKKIDSPHAKKLLQTLETKMNQPKEGGKKVIVIKRIRSLVEKLSSVTNETK